MKVNGRMIDERLKRFMASAPVCRLVVVDCSKGCECDADVLDLGLELSNAISGLDRHSRSFFLKVERSLNDLVGRHCIKTDDLGDVVVIRNVGIMFEPELNFNFTEFLRKISRNTLTILLWPGEIGPDRLFFLSTNSDHFISRSELNYSII